MNVEKIVMVVCSSSRAKISHHAKGAGEKFVRCYNEQIG